MTHSASFGVEPELKKAIDAQASRAAPGHVDAIQVRIIEEELRLVHTFDPTSSPSAMATAVRHRLQSEPHTPCFVVCVEGEACVLAAYVPEGAGVRDKMVYSSGREGVRRAAGAAGVRVRERQWGSVEEVGLGEEEGWEKQKLELMSEVERMGIEDAKLTAKEAAGDKVSSASLSFPLTEAASARLAAFINQECSLFLLGIHAETVDLHPSPTQANISELRSHLPQASPSYCVYRYQHTRDGETKEPTIFLYTCPEHSPVRAKMLHASTKAAVLAHITREGVQVARSIEVTELSEVQEELLLSELYPPDEQTKAISKPQPRAGRKLTKRRDA